MADTIFLTYTCGLEDEKPLRRLIASLRAFGGLMSACPVWVFAPAGELGFTAAAGEEPVRVLPLELPPGLPDYPFGQKVAACATAEQLAPSGLDALVWIDPSCLVVNPPIFYALEGAADAAFRPVHIRNVGLPAGVPLDSYWQRVYHAAGVEDLDLQVEPFAGGPALRAYFNTHAFALNPALCLLQRWLLCFAELAADAGFQAGLDTPHRIFLHQAALSALAASLLEPGRLRILPPDYNYPYNLHPSLPASRQAQALNDLVTFTYEGRSIHPDEVRDIEIREPLRGWLFQHAG